MGGIKVPQDYFFRKLQRLKAFLLISIVISFSLGYFAKQIINGVIQCLN